MLTYAKKDKQKLQNNQQICEGWFIARFNHSMQPCVLVFSWQHYCSLMKAFWTDDQDHDVSVVSLSVQIFTVVSLVCH